MIKRLIKIFSFLLTLIVIIIFYLTFFGFNTEQFNEQIKTQVLKINKSLNLELKTVKILLSPRDLTVKIKTLEPKIFIDNNKFELKHIKTNISLKSLVNRELSIDNLQISTKIIKLDDLILLARSFKNTPQLFILDNIVKGGYLVGDLNFNFDDKGKIKNDYKINGFIEKGKIRILKKYSIDNLNFSFNIKYQEYYFEDVKTHFNKIKLTAPSIKIKEKNDQFLINGKFISDKEDFNIKLLDNLLNDTFKNNNIEKIIFSSDNSFNFNLNKKLKISNFNLESVIDLNKLVYKGKFFNTKKYLPDYQNLIELEDNKILLSFKKNQIEIDGKGKLIINDKIENLNYKIHKKKGHYLFDTNIDVKKNSVIFNTFDYKKKEGENLSIRLKGIYKKDKSLSFGLISFTENENKFLVNDLFLDKNFRILNFKKLNINFVNTNQIENKINIRRNKNKYIVTGESLDISKLVDESLKDDHNKSSNLIFTNSISNWNIQIKKTYIDKDTFMNNLNGSISLKKNEIDKLNLKSIFPNDKKLTLTIITNEDNEKITTFFSDYPKPLIKQYKFIKGFENGVLDFYSFKKNGITKSKLIIDNFKVQEVPVLAKLLTLASLQGIADLLTGEGIRFTDLEMNFSTNKGLMTIEEMYAIGPAISILLEGYIESQKLVSLRGTLVPATTINRSIASIPLIGNILIGNKTGEGIFGVSFKIKGPPKNLKTTVNPIKTLTPRFITRTLEKIKKN
jgi:hypothetical protein